MKTSRFAPHDRFTVGASAFGLALIAILALFSACLFSGCSVLGAYKPVVPSVQTNDVVTQVLSPIELIEWRTNTVVVTNVLPGERIVVTNVQAVAPVIVFTNEVLLVTNRVVATNGFVVNPQFQDAVESGRRLNSAFNPTPTAPMVDWGLSLATLAAGAVAAWKTRSAKKAEVLRDTLIKAVETAPPGLGAAIKRHVAGVADLRGVSGDLDSAVQRVTAAMADGHMSAEEFVALANDPTVTEDMIPEAIRPAFRKFRA
jgi:hypothetical protein